MDRPKRQVRFTDSIGTVSGHSLTGHVAVLVQIDVAATLDALRFYLAVILQAHRAITAGAAELVRAFHAVHTRRVATVVVSEIHP